MDQEVLNNIDFDDEDTVCPKCGDYGVYLPPFIKNSDGKVTANFKYNNGHPSTKRYRLKGESKAKKKSEKKKEANMMNC